MRVLNSNVVGTGKRKPSRSSKNEHPGRIKRDEDLVVARYRLYCTIGDVFQSIKLREDRAERGGNLGERAASLGFVSIGDENRVVSESEGRFRDSKHRPDVLRGEDFAEAHGEVP